MACVCVVRTSIPASYGAPVPRFVFVPRVRRCCTPPQPVDGVCGIKALTPYDGERRVERDALDTIAPC